jgi:hypothetical protein
MELPTSKLCTTTQTKTRRAEWTEGNDRMTMVVTIRWDDTCRNGHNSFAITADVRRNSREDCGGCCHDIIAARVPELAPYIKWHLVSSDGPMHYLANVTYHASDRDHNGLLKGEKKQIRNGKTGKLAWKREDVTLTQYIDADEKPTGTQLIGYEPWCITGEGKARDFKAARNSAVWPEATDEQLSLPKAELTALLMARLPALMAEFKAAIESLGFVY